MNEPLASAAGNAVEVLNAVEFLTGAHIDRRLFDVTVALGGELLVLGGLAKDDAEGRRRIEDAFSSGAAADLFGRMVSALGGPADFMERPESHLAAAPVVKPVAPERAGIVTAIDTRAIGIAVVELGGGRAKPEDTIDHAVGFTRLAGLGSTRRPRRPAGAGPRPRRCGGRPRRPLAPRDLHHRRHRAGKGAGGGRAGGG
jgi:thymidine phosphorylase